MNDDWLEETYARLAGFGAPPEVHDREYSLALSRANRGRMVARKALNRTNPADARSLARGCARALVGIGLAHDYLGRLTAHRAFREDPGLHPPRQLHPLASVEKTYRASIRDVEDYFLETCVLGHALTPEETREATRLLGEQVKREVDELRRKLPRLPGVRGPLRLVPLPPRRGRLGSLGAGGLTSEEQRYLDVLLQLPAPKDRIADQATLAELNRRGAVIGVLAGGAPGVAPWLDVTKLGFRVKLYLMRKAGLLAGLLDGLTTASFL